MSATYTVHDLPKDAVGLSPILNHFVEFRLDILERECDHLALTHAYESGFTKSMWIARLLDSKKHYFIVVAHRTSDHKLRGLEDGEWVGMLQLLGPLSRSEYVVSGSGQPDVGSDSEEIRFHSASWYIHPSHRGGEATLQLLEHALNFIRCLADDILSLPPGTPRYARVRGTVAPYNTKGAGFQEALGCRSIGWWTMAQAYQALDFAEVIAPKEEAPKLYEAKGHRVIENVFEC